LNGKSGKTESTRQKLQDAFWDIYAESSLKNITVRAITERAGVNRSTFYAYYKDVYDILEQAENDILDNFNYDIRWKGNILDHDQHEKNLRSFGDFLQQYQKPLMVLLGDKGDPRFSSRLWNIVRSNLLESLKNISASPDDPMLAYIAEYVINCHSGIFMLWFKNGCDIPFEKISEIIYQLMTGGVLPLVASGSNPYDKIADYILKRIKEKL